MSASKEQMEALEVEMFAMNTHIDIAMKEVQEMQVGFKDYVDVKFAQYKVMLGGWWRRRSRRKSAFPLLG